MKLVHWVFGVCLFTSSCDVILNFNLGGSFRLAQVLMFFICLAAVARIVQDGRILWPRGASALALWVVVQLIFLPLAGVWSIGLMFFSLLVFTVVGVLAVVQLYGQSDMIEPLVKMYLLSFVAVAAYGLIQFITPLFGVVAPFTAQFYVNGKLARINAFSFEPSYFVTYMILGWIMVIDLRISKARIVEGRFWKWAAIALTAAMFFSTSKGAWGVMLVEVAFRFGGPVLRYLKRIAYSGKVLIWIPSSRGVAAGVVLIAFAFAGSLYLHKLSFDPASFLSGTGLAGSASHSLDTRVGDGLDTFHAFLDAPLIGRSVGGVAVYRAHREGVKVTTMAEVRTFWGFPVIFDVLLASGAIGVIPFLVFLYTTSFGAMRMATRYWPEERAKWLRAMGRAMIFEWLLLAADQNLFRIYLWFHFTMVLLVAYHLEFAPAPQPLPETAKQSYLPTFEASPLYDATP